jgi:indole-3-glycerol phosphate synthase
MENDILKTIAAKTRERIAAEKRRMPTAEIRAMAEEKAALITDCTAEEGGAFRRALAAPGISFICECKKASPSKGVIAEAFDPVSIARDYEDAGASAISCLTEPYWFMGKNAYAREIAHTVNIPVLRKDFTVDEYMIYEAREMGASAILLICAILDDAELSAYRQLARELKLDVLTEAHDEREVMRALRSGADIVGVNNRNLRDFSVDVNNSLRLRKLVPDSVVFVSESGIRTPEDVAKLRENGTDAVLIGETLMRADDKKAMLDRLRGKSA